MLQLADPHAPRANLGKLGVNRRLVPTCGQLSVTAHNVVRQVEHLGKDHARGFVNANVIAGGLAHAQHAIRAHKDRHCEHNLRAHSVRFHELAPRHEVEELFCAAHLHIRLQRNRVISLHQRIEELLQANGITLGVALGSCRVPKTAAP